MNIRENLVIKNQYQVLKKIGTGATALVYLGFDRKNNRKVALKIQKKLTEISSLEERFELEGKSLLKFSNPNIVKVYDYFVWDEYNIIVMEYLSGLTLDVILEQKGTLSSSVIAKFALQIINALIDIKKKGIMHRDLKPSNIMIGFDNNLKLMDFGIVQASHEQNLTRQKAIIGTIQYIAPEILNSEKASEYSELYSLGIIMYKMTTGVLPFNGPTPEEIATKHLHSKPLLPSKINSNVDPEIEKIILKLLEKDYFNRFSSADALREKLIKFLDNEHPKKQTTEKQLKHMKKKPGIVVDNKKKLTTKKATTKKTTLWAVLSVMITSAIGVAIVLILFSVGLF